MNMDAWWQIPRKGPCDRLVVLSAVMFRIEWKYFIIIITQLYSHTNFVLGCDNRYVCVSFTIEEILDIVYILFESQ